MNVIRIYRRAQESFAGLYVSAQPRRTSWSALLRSDARARPVGDHPRAPVPARSDLAQHRPAAHGQAEGPPGAGRVLGLLPRQLAANDSLPEGVARALRGRGP